MNYGFNLGINSNSTYSIFGWNEIRKGDLVRDIQEVELRGFDDSMMWQDKRGKGVGRSLGSAWIQDEYRLPS